MKMNSHLLVFKFCLIICAFAGAQVLYGQNETSVKREQQSMEYSSKIIFSDKFSRYATRNGKGFCTLQYISTDGNDKNFERIRIDYVLEHGKFYSTKDGKRILCYTITETRIIPNCLEIREVVYDPWTAAVAWCDKDTVCYVRGKAAIAKSPIYVSKTDSIFAWDEAGYKEYDDYEFQISRDYFNYLSEKLKGLVEIKSK